MVRTVVAAEAARMAEGWVAADLTRRPHPERMRRIRVREVPRRIIRRERVIGGTRFTVAAQMRPVRTPGRMRITSRRNASLEATTPGRNHLRLEFTARQRRMRGEGAQRLRARRLLVRHTFRCRGIRWAEVLSIHFIPTADLDMVSDTVGWDLGMVRLDRVIRSGADAMASDTAAAELDTDITAEGTEGIRRTMDTAGT